jgi:type IV pilus assembly protein PilX
MQENTTINYAARHLRPRQEGATLVVGLVLLLVLTLLGVSGMNTATLEVQMAGNTQFQQDAFQAAETGIDLSISMPNTPGLPMAPVPVTALGDGSYSTQARKNCVFSQHGAPDNSYSKDSATSWYFEIIATGTGPRNARSTHTQGFFKLGAYNPITVC